jgi:hypothetical protein
VAGLRVNQFHSSVCNTNGQPPPVRRIEGYGKDLAGSSEWREHGVARLRISNNENKWRPASVDPRRGEVPAVGAERQVEDDAGDLGEFAG